MMSLQSYEDEVWRQFPALREILKEAQGSAHFSWDPVSSLDAGPLEQFSRVMEVLRRLEGNRKVLLGGHDPQLLRQANNELEELAARAQALEAFIRSELHGRFLNLAHEVRNREYERAAAQQKP
jgi:hypothetical protein